MTPHTAHPALGELAALVHQQRRLLAGRIRIEREQHELHEKIETLLAIAGVDVVACTIPLGTFEVRRAVTRDGRRYASVTPSTDDPTS
jgi:hypothetical protein